MRKTIPMVLALLVSAGTAWADHYQKYWPLDDGNSWTYSKSNPVARFAPYSVSVQGNYSGVAWVEGLPGLEDGVWLAWSGNTLYAWNKSAKAWREFLKFGAVTGTTYTVNLDHALWLNVQVKVKTKSERFYDAQLNKTFYNCVRFTFVNTMVADAGVTHFVVAPKVGIVHWSEQSLIGPTNAVLMSATLAGKKLGKVIFSALDQGPKTQFPTNDAKLLVFNDPTAWTTFWMQHKPGTAAPSVDFGKQSAIVVIAGWRPNWGYSVSVQNILWNYPQKSVTVSVLETTPTGPTPNPMSKPYCIVTTNEKVFTATMKWKVQSAP